MSLLVFYKFAVQTSMWTNGITWGVGSCSLWVYVFLILPASNDVCIWIDHFKRGHFWWIKLLSRRILESVTFDTNDKKKKFVLTNCLNYYLRTKSWFKTRNMMLYKSSKNTFHIFISCCNTTLIAVCMSAH